MLDKPFISSAWRARAHAISVNREHGDDKRPPALAFVDYCLFRQAHGGVGAIIDGIHCRHANKLADSGMASERPPIAWHRREDFNIMTPAEKTSTLWRFHHLQSIIDASLRPTRNRWASGQPSAHHETRAALTCVRLSSAAPRPSSVRGDPTKR